MQFLTRFVYKLNSFENLIYFPLRNITKYNPNPISIKQSNTLINQFTNQQPNAHPTNSQSACQSQSLIHKAPHPSKRFQH